jgi:hypothetical protein
MAKKKQKKKENKRTKKKKHKKSKTKKRRRKKKRFGIISADSWRLNLMFNNLIFGALILNIFSD